MPPVLNTRVNLSIWNSALNFLAFVFLWYNNYVQCTQKTTSVTCCYDQYWCCVASQHSCIHEPRSRYVVYLLRTLCQLLSGYVRILFVSWLNCASKASGTARRKIFQQFPPGFPFVTACYNFFCTPSSRHIAVVGGSEPYTIFCGY